MVFILLFFFFNDTATTEIYTVGNTLSLHDALPISTPGRGDLRSLPDHRCDPTRSEEHTSELQSLPTISYAVFCLKKKKIHKKHTPEPSYVSIKHTTLVRQRS